MYILKGNDNFKGKRFKALIQFPIQVHWVRFRKGEHGNIHVLRFASGDGHGTRTFGACNMVMDNKNNLTMLLVSEY